MHTCELAQGSPICVPVWMRHPACPYQDLCSPSPLEAWFHNWWALVYSGNVSPWKINHVCIFSSSLILLQVREWGGDSFAGSLPYCLFKHGPLCDWSKAGGGTWSLVKFHVTALRLGAGKRMLLEVRLKVRALRQQPLFSLRRLEFKYEPLQKVGDLTFSIAEGLSLETRHALQRVWRLECQGPCKWRWVGNLHCFQADYLSCQLHYFKLN